MKHGWKSGFHIKGDAGEAAAHLEQLRKRHGGFITPAQIVADARRGGSPLHSYFEWDDAKAAEAYRLEQAAYLIRAIVLEPEEGEEFEEVRAFVSLNPDDGYSSLAAVMDDDQMRDQLFEQARSDILVWRKKYRHLQKFAEVFAAVDKVLAGA